MNFPLTRVLLLNLWHNILFFYSPTATALRDFVYFSTFLFTYLYLSLCSVHGLFASFLLLNTYLRKMAFVFLLSSAFEVLTI